MDADIGDSAFRVPIRKIYKWNKNKDHVARTISVIVLIAMFFVQANIGEALEASFIQDSWEGGVSAQEATQTGWTKYAGKDDNLDITDDGNLKLKDTPGQKLQTSDADFTIGATHVNTEAKNDSVILTNTVAGNNWTDFNTSNTRAPCANGARTGSALTYANGFVYILCSGTDGFYRFNGTQWSSALAPIPASSVTAGGALAFNGANTIYAFAGGGYSPTARDFFSYNTVTNSWLQLNDIIRAIGEGASLTYAPSPTGYFLYALRGGNNITTMRYNNIWDDSIPNLGAGNNVKAGGSLAWDGGDSLYAFRGGGTTDMRKYSISGNVWTSPATLPAASNDGSALGYAGSGNFYAIFGGSSTFRRYTASGGWTANATNGFSLAMPGVTVGPGGALAYDGQGTIYAIFGNSTNIFKKYTEPFSAYASSGTFTSSVINIGEPKSLTRFDYNVSIPTGTSISFEIRAGNTQSSDSSWDQWKTVPANKIISGLFSGTRQYVQYRAILSTTNNRQTPSLSDVTINYKGYPQSASLISSKYRMGATADSPVVRKVSWYETVPSNTLVKMQIRTSPDANFSAPYDTWYGAGTSVNNSFSNLESTCTKTNWILGSQIITCTVDPASPVNNLGMSYVQYKMILESSFQVDTPTVWQASLTYAINTPPAVSNVQVLENNPSAGDFRVTYDISDNDQTSFNVGLFYDIGLRLANNVAPNDVVISVETPNNADLSSLIQPEGIILINNEQIKYQFVGRNTFGNSLIKPLQRAVYNTEPATFHDALLGGVNQATVWVRATDSEVRNDPDGWITQKTIYAMGDVGSNISCGTPRSTCGKTMQWTPAKDVRGNVYRPNAQSIKVVANDKEVVRQSGGAISGNFTFDTQPPIFNTQPAILANNVVDIVSFGLKTKSTAINLSIVTPATTDTDGNMIDNPIGSDKMAFCVGATCGTPSGADLLGGTASGWTPTTPPAFANSFDVSITNNQSQSQKINFAAFDGSGNVTFDNISSIIYDATPPPVPAGFTAQDITASLPNPAAYVSWDPLDWTGKMDGYQRQDFAKIELWRDKLSCQNPISGFCKATTLVDPTTTSFIDIGVTRGQTYAYRIVAEDDVGNVSNQITDAGIPQATVSIAAVQGTQPPPRIVNVSQKPATTNSITILWDTVDDSGNGVPSDSYIAYLAQSSLPADFKNAPTQGSAALSTNGVEADGVCECHLITLVGLRSGTQYYFELRSTAGSATAIQTGQSFTFSTQAEPPKIVPIISNAHHEDITKRSATIKWDTKTSDSQPLDADSFVEYGETISLGSYYGQRDSTSAHMVLLSGLEPNKTYYYRVHSTPAVSNSGEGVFPDSLQSPLTFTTSQDTEDTTPPDISGVTVSGIQFNTAAIGWNTVNDPTTGYVEFWTEGADHRLWPITPLSPKTSQSMQLPLDLDADKDYIFKIIAFDSSNNRGESSEQAFHTAKAPDNIPSPIISDARNDTPTATNVIVYWTTNVPSDSVVLFSKNDQSFSSTQSNPLITTDHVVALVNLNPGMQYFYKVRSTNLNGVSAESETCNSGQCAFTTQLAKGEVPEIIQGSIAVSDIEPNRATIKWRTTKPGNSLVEFGTEAIEQNGKPIPIYGRTFGDIKDNTTDHTVVLPDDLVDGQTYHFRLHTRDVFDQAVVYPGSPDPSDLSCQGDRYNCLDPTFVTEASSLSKIYESKYPPQISQVAAVLVTDTKAVIGWQTDKSADSEVNYGVSDTYGSRVENKYKTGTGEPDASALTRTHAITIEGLQPSTQYFFKVASTDIADQRNEDDNNGNGYTFTTNAGTQKGGTTIIGCTENCGGRRDTSPPVISDISVSKITDISAVVSWITNESANSVVQYGKDDFYGSLSGDYTTFRKDHGVDLRNLEPGTEYHFSVVSYDESANESHSDDQTFTTTGTKLKDGDEGEIIIDGECDSGDCKDKDDKEGSGACEDDDEGATCEQAKKIASLLIDFSEDDIANILRELGLQLVSPPKFIGGAPTVDVTQTTAIIRWRTDRDSNSTVAYTEDAEYDSSKDDPYSTETGDSDEMVVEHVVELKNLTQGTLYHYQLRSAETGGRSAISQDRTFKTLPIKPEIQKIRVLKRTEHAVTLSWKTTVPTKTIIDYTNKKTGEKRSQGDPQFVSNHTFTITDLDADTTYKATIRAETESELAVISDAISFSTIKDIVSPELTQIRVRLSISPGKEDIVQGVISWKTDEPADTVVFFDEGIIQEEPKRSSIPQGDFTTTHVVVLQKLRPSTNYRFKAVSKDQAGNAGISKIFKFRTPPKNESVLELIIKNFEEAFGFLREVQ